MTYQLRASAGQLVEVDVQSGTDDTWEVQRSNGTTVLAIPKGSDHRLSRRILPADDDYRLVTAGTTAGPYEVRVRISDGGGEAACADAFCGMVSWSNGRVVTRAGPGGCLANVPLFVGTAPGVAGLNDALANDARVFVNGFEADATVSCSWSTGSVTITPSMVAVTIFADFFVLGAAHPMDDVATVAWDLETNTEVLPSTLLEAGTDGGRAAWRSLFDLFGQQIHRELPDLDLSLAQPSDTADGSAVLPTATGMRVGFGRCVLVGCAAGTITADIPYGELDGIVRAPTRRLFEGIVDER